MKNSQQVKVARQGDFVIVTEDNEDPEASFSVVELSTEGAALYVNAGVIGSVSTSFTSGISARIYDHKAPLWTELLFGKEVREAASGVADGREVQDVVVEHVEPRTAWGVKRVAQGLWMRRYWPVSRERNIPATATDLLDLELGALLCEPYVGTCFSDYLVETLLLPRREKAIELAAQLRHKPEAVFERLRGILTVVLEWYMEQAEEDEDSSEEETEQLLRTLETALAQAEGSFELEPSYIDDDLDIFQNDDLALAASGDESESFPNFREESVSLYFRQYDESSFGRATVSHDTFLPTFRNTTCVDWTQNVHGLVDAASPIHWENNMDRGSIVWVEPQSKHKTLLDEIWVRVYEIGMSLPQVKRMELNEGRIQAYFDIPPEKIQLADIYSIPEYGPPLKGAERERQEKDQGRAITWAEGRIRRVKRFIDREDEPLPGWQSARTAEDLDTPWIAEYEAEFQVQIEAGMEWF